MEEEDTSADTVADGDDAGSEDETILLVDEFCEGAVVDDSSKVPTIEVV